METAAKQTVLTSMAAQGNLEGLGEHSLDEVVGAGSSGALHCAASPNRWYDLPRSSG